MSNNRTTMLGDIFRLLGGAGLTQAIAIGSMPILSRMFAPEAFGHAALFIAVVTICASVVCLRYEFAIVLPEKETDAVNIACLSGVCAVVVSLTLFGLVLVFGPLWGGNAGLREVAPFLVWIPVVTLLIGVIQIFNKWNARLNRFTRQSVTMVGQRLTSALGSIAAGVAGFATGGALILMQIASSGVGAFLSASLAAPSLCAGIGRRVTWSRMWSLAVRYRKLPIFNSWSGLMNTASVNLPPLMLALLFSPSIAGLYALGYRVIARPSQVVGGAVSQVFFRRAVDSKRDGTLGVLADKTFYHLTLLVGFPFLFLCITGPALFEIVFGGEWREAGFYVQILSPWLFCVFLGTPLSSLNIILEVQEMGLLVNVLLLLTRVGSLLFGAWLGDPLVALSLFSVSGVLVWGYYINFLMQKSGVSTGMVLKRTFIGILLALASLGPLIGCSLAGWFNAYTALPLLVLCGAAYVSLVCRTSPELSGQVRDVVRKIRKKESCSS